MIMFAGGVIGLLAGLHAATWGMCKDAPHEGFSRQQCVRSPVLRAALRAVSQPLTGVNPTHAGAALLLFGVIHAVERALAETYKTFFFPSKPAGQVCRKAGALPGDASQTPAFRPPLRRPVGRALHRRI